MGVYFPNDSNSETPIAPAQNRMSALDDDFVSALLARRPAAQATSANTTERALRY